MGMGSRVKSMTDGGAPSAAIVGNRVAFCRGDRESNRTDFSEFLFLFFYFRIDFISPPFPPPSPKNERASRRRGGWERRIGQSNDVEFKAPFFFEKKKHTHTYLHTYIHWLN